MAPTWDESACDHRPMSAQLTVIYVSDLVTAAAQPCIKVRPRSIPSPSRLVQDGNSESGAVPQDYADEKSLLAKLLSS